MQLAVNQLTSRPCSACRAGFRATHVRTGSARSRYLAVRAQSEDSSAGLQTNSLFANNPKFAAAFQSAVQREGQNVVTTQPSSVTAEVDERPAPHEEIILNCLQVSRRNIRNFEAIEKTIKYALESEQQQFERLHFAYKKIKSDAAYLKHLERRLEQEKAKNKSALH